MALTFDIVRMSLPLKAYVFSLGDIITDSLNDSENTSQVIAKYAHLMFQKQKQILHESKLNLID